MTFRFDDVCVNVPMQLHNRMVAYLLKKFDNPKIIFGVSPVVFDMGYGFGKNNQRVFPSEIKALSDYTEFYKGSIAGVPKWENEMYITPASHGLCHVDHRLLSYGAQEMSILISCALTKSKIFVPPFNKWNTDTELVCIRHRIELVKFEDGWKSMEYNKYDKEHELYYLHAREWTMDNFKKWFEG